MKKDKAKSPDTALLDRLAELGLFRGIPRQEIAEIVEFIDGAGVVRFARGETVVYEGTKAKWVMPVLSGCLNVFESASNGERHHARVIETGGLFGATLVTTNLEYYPGMAIAAEPCEVIFFSSARIRELWVGGRYRRFFENLYSEVSSEVLGCWRKLSILTCKRAEDRFMLYLRWYAAEKGESDVTLPFPTMEDGAKYLGLTRTALSLAIKRLVKRGEIAHPGRGRFVIRGII